MKYIKGIAVIFVLFVFPLGSWYFLQYGLNWRIDKRELLVPKIDLNSILVDNTLSSDYTDKTSLVRLKSSNSDKETIVREQFEGAYTFQWMEAGSGIDLTHEILKDVNYMLVDTGMNVRRLYKGDHDTIFAHMVEDISLVMPRRKELDIKMKESRSNE